MMKKVWPVLLAVVLVFGFAFVGCGGGGSGDGDGDGEDVEEFEFTGPFVYNLWGENKPTYDEETGLVTFSNVSGSMGFVIKFEEIGYTYNAKDVLVFTYEIEVTTPSAVLIAKTPSMGDLASTGGAGWGRGKGWEYVLGDAEKSVYDGPLVAGTYDPATKTGTFEVLVKLLPSSTTGIGFQHNYWADNNGDGNKIAEHSEYSLKFTKIANKAGGSGDGDGDGDGELTEEEQEEAFAAAVGLKGLTQSTSGNNVEIDTETGIISREASDGYGAWISVAIPETTLATPIIASDTIVITYIGLGGNIPIILKQSNTTTDISSSGQYQTLTGDGTVRTLNIPAERYGAAIPTAVWTFQANKREDGDWQLKIIDITVTHGDPIKATLAVAGLKPSSGATPVTTLDTLQFTGTVTWVGNPTTFAAGTAYTATIALTKKDGYTFAGIAANAFVVTGATTVTHEAGTDTLSITAVFPETAPPAPDKTITFTADDLTQAAAVGGDITAVTATGFTVTTTGGYGGGYGYIEVTFAEGYTLGDYTKIDFNFAAADGDASNKSLRVWAFAAAPTGQMNDTSVNKLGQSSNNATGAAQNGTITFTADASVASANKVYVVFNIWSNPVALTVSNIKFYN